MLPELGGGQDRRLKPVRVNLPRNSSGDAVTTTFPLINPQQRRQEGGKTIKTYENPPLTPSQRLLSSPDIPEATKARMQAENARLDPFTLKKEIERKLKNFFTLLGNLDRESTKTRPPPAFGNIHPWGNSTGAPDG